MSMITVSEAHERLARNNRVRVGDETVDLKDCLGRVLAKDVVSSIDVPPADNSAMDGYALRREDWQEQITHWKSARELQREHHPGHLSRAPRPAFLPVLKYPKVRILW